MEQEDEKIKIRLFYREPERCVTLVTVKGL